MQKAESDFPYTPVGSGMLARRTLRSFRHTTQFWEAGPSDGPLMIFLHGWPEIGLVWRAQMHALVTDGWRCVAPDMRGYGGSSAPSEPQAYALARSSKIWSNCMTVLVACLRSGLVMIWEALLRAPWPRTIPSAAEAWFWFPFPISRTDSPWQLSFHSSIGRYTRRTSIPTGNGITVVSTSIISIKRWAISMRTSPRHTRRSIGPGTPHRRDSPIARQWLRATAGGSVLPSRACGGARSRALAAR
jgi:hypothetical protein